MFKRMFSRKKKEGDAAKEDDSESNHGFSFLKKSKCVFCVAFESKTSCQEEKPLDRPALMCGRSALVPKWESSPMQVPSWSTPCSSTPSVRVGA